MAMDCLVIMSIPFGYNIMIISGDNIILGLVVLVMEIREYR